jgi:hypothetical protein
MIKSIGIPLLLILPAFLVAQEPYKETPFQLGLDPDKPNPIGLTGRLKVHAARAASPRVFLVYAAIAGVDQATNAYGAWGGGAEAYGKRYATEFGRNFMRETMAFGMDGILKTDPRYYRSKPNASFGGRIGNALLQVFVTRTDSGRKVPAIASLGSAFAAGQISTLWLPPRDSQFSDGLGYSAWLIGGDAGRNLLREFWPDIKRKLHH